MTELSEDDEPNPCIGTICREEHSMRFGTVVFEGAIGNHTTAIAPNAEAALSNVKYVGTGGVYTNVVACRLCERELVAYENGLAPEAKR